MWKYVLRYLVCSAFLSWSNFRQMPFLTYWDDQLFFILHFVGLVYQIYWLAYIQLMLPQSWHCPLWFGHTELILAPRTYHKPSAPGCLFVASSLHRRTLSSTLIANSYISLRSQLKSYLWDRVLDSLELGRWPRDGLSELTFVLFH